MHLLDLLEYIDVDKTVLQMGDKLKQRFSQDHTIDDNYDPSEFIKYVSDDVDPTKNQQYSLWILRTYSKGGINFSEDLGRTNIAIKKFIQTKPQLSIKDIGQIKTLSDLETLVDSVEPQQSGKEQKRQLSNEIKKDTTIYYRGPEGMILIPKTEEASCFWGKGTKWCTSAITSHNQFNSYTTNGNGPLYIIMPNDGTKWQFHLNSGSLMDSRNGHFNVVEFKQKYPWVFKTIKFSEKDQLAAVGKNAENIRFIDHPSEELQLFAVTQNVNAIKYIIEAGINPSEELQLAAVKSSGYAIKSIIEAGINPSEELQLAAVKSAGYAIEYILNASIKPSEDVQLAAVQGYSESISDIIRAGIIPSEDVQLAAVQNLGNTIYDIIKAGIKPSEDVQLAAVNSYGYAISYIRNAGIKPSQAVLDAAHRQG